MTQYLCWSNFMQKYSPLPSRVNWVFANPPITIVELPNCSTRGWLTFQKTLVLVSSVRILWARDDKEPIMTCIVILEFPNYSFV